MNPEEFNETGTLGLAIYVLVEIFKRAGFPSRYSPILSLVLGLGIGAISFILTDKSWVAGLGTGFWSAASASGVYAGTKAVFTPKQPTFLSTAALSTEDDPALHPSC